MELKTREKIELIKNGDIPENYKKTECGIIPKDWSIIPLGTLMKFKNGINASKEKFGTGIKIISVKDILQENVITYNEINGKINIDEKTLDIYDVSYGDILFQRSSENFEDAGKSNVYMDKDNRATFSGFVIRGKKTEDYDPLYLNMALKNREVRKQIMRKAAGSQHINIGQTSLEQIVVPYPNISEQKRISIFLNKFDNLIRNQRTLIEKLKLKKKSILNKVLNDEIQYKKIKLGDICNITTGKLDANQMEKDGKYPFFTCSKEIFFINNFDFDTEALLIAGNGDIGDIKYYKGKFNAYQRTYVLSDFKIDIKYVMYFLEKNLKKYIFQGMQKSSMPYIKKEVLENIEIGYCNEEKMKKIIILLDSISKNIQLNEKKLELLKKQRKVLQKLILTGIIRV